MSCIKSVKILVLTLASVEINRFMVWCEADPKFSIVYQYRDYRAERKQDWAQHLENL